MVQGRFDLVASVRSEEEGCYGKEKCVVFLFPSQAHIHTRAVLAEKCKPKFYRRGISIGHNATYSFLASLIGHGGAGGVVRI